MKNFIGHIHDTRKLSASQLTDIEARIKAMLELDTIEIKNVGGGLYSVTTNDTNILDFHIDSNNKISFTKYISFNDEGKRDDAGANLTRGKITANE